MPATVLRLDNFRQERNMLTRMRIAVIGGGPGGLYFSALASSSPRSRAAHEITVWERNAADDTFGFGVVFSDETLGGIEHADPAIYPRCSASSRSGTTSTSTSRARWSPAAATASRRMSRRAPAGDPAGPLPRARRDDPLPHRGPRRRRAGPHATTWWSPRDGLGSAVRARYADTFRPTLDERDCKYIWLGTDKVFDAFKFYVAQTPYGVMQIHGYPYDATRQHVHRRDDLRGVGASRVRRVRRPGVGAGGVRREVDRADPGAVRRRA